MKDNKFQPDDADEQTEDPYEKELALFYWQEGYEYQTQGQIGAAIELYMRSIDLLPTAEAHTFLGWAYHTIGRIYDAIEECYKAIKIDPSFGNPYNDIGSYLIELDELDAAIPWFEKAIEAPRYDERAYPHMNLGYVWEQKLEWKKAMACYRQALHESPDYEMALEALRKLKAQLN